MSKKRKYALKVGTVVLVFARSVDTKVHKTPLKRVIEPIK